MTIKTFTVPGKGVGKDDYSTEVFRGKQTFGYELEYGEQLLWMTIICQDVPGPSIITRLPLAVGETMRAIDFATGDDEAIIPAGWDWLFKEIWVSFDQDVEFQMFQGGTFNDVSCAAYIEAGSKPPNIAQTGCSRGLTEDLSIPSVLRVTIKNLGGGPARGKVWLAAVTKEGFYTWR